MSFRCDQALTDAAPDQCIRVKTRITVDRKSPEIYPDAADRVCCQAVIVKAFIDVCYPSLMNIIHFDLRRTGFPGMAFMIKMQIGCTVFHDVNAGVRHPAPDG